MNEVKKLKFNRYQYQNKIYKESQWFNILSDFLEFNEKKISLRKDMPNLNLAYIKKTYLDNIRKSTFLGLILPCVAFLSISLLISQVALFLQNKRKIDEYQNSYIFLIFLGFLFLIFGIIFLIKLLKREKLVFTRNRYRYLSKQEFLQKMKIFQLHEYLYFQPLITDRLIIREFDEDDESDYFHFVSSEKVCRYLNCEVIKNKELVKDIIKTLRGEYKEEQIFKLALEINSTHKVIGYIGLSRFDLSEESCQIVYAIHEDYWQKGYVSEAVKAFVNYLKIRGKKLIIAGHVEENTASGKVLLKSGFNRDQSRDTQMLIHGELKNIISYSIDERKNV